MLERYILRMRCKAGSSSSVGQFTMPIADITEISATEPLDADVCIVGSGPAGATIAAELAGAGARIVLLESGGLERQADTDALNEVESVGWHRIEDQWLVRNRILGGTSCTWGGRVAPFEDIDYEARSWIAHSGWPVSRDEMTSFLERSVPYLGLTVGTGYSDDAFWAWAKRRKETPKIDEDRLVPCFWQFSRDEQSRFEHMRFGRRLVRDGAGEARIFVNATVTHINTNADGTVAESVEVRARDGSIRIVAAPHIIICAGGIENARLLLASNRIMSKGLGNQNDLVGRFLMDHLRGRVASVDVRGAERLQNWFGIYNVKGARNSNHFRHGLRLNSDYQRKNRLLNCAAFLSDAVSDDDPWLALYRINGSKRVGRRDAALVASNLGLLARGAYNRFVRNKGLTRKYAFINLECMVEQMPRSDSRVSLSDRKDRFGVPISRIDWKVSDLEHQTVRATARLLCSEFKRLGLNELVLDGWVAKDLEFPSYFRDVAHPTGTTRMSTDPKDGVVDPQGQVHGVRGLWITGSSIFPTAGHANPTQMIVAFAIRLADRVKRHLQEDNQ
jgi:choline dehydrogenase-like flavoprotein